MDTSSIYLGIRFDEAAAEHHTCGKEIMLTLPLPPPKIVGSVDRNPNCNLPLLSHASTSRDFSSLSEASWQKVTKRGYGFPFDSTSPGFKHTVAEKGFRFEDIQEAL
jgi:hypothetical protein